MSLRTATIKLLARRTHGLTTLLAILHREKAETFRNTKTDRGVVWNIAK